MAVDEAILLSHARGLVPPTVRLYGWEPPALSIGHLQSALREVDLEACKRLGIDMVRRPTGGRAVLHDEEVTYSIIIRESDPLLPKSLQESYSLVAKGIIRGLEALGVKAQIRGPARAQRDRVAGVQMGANARISAEPGRNVEVPRRGDRLSGACFDSPAWYEIVVDGKKLVGSAQARLSGVFLQHGSILLSLDVEKQCSVLAFPSERERALAKRSLASRATSLKEILGRDVSFNEVSMAIIGGIQESLEVELTPGGLIYEELETARELISQKYANDRWNLRR